ncbi:MAG: hypothetical protein JW994_04075 [Candidatus Omnitrophica bacterium]|nr:hypothetical protein [Candidatus Omnitrophota bacterium]
MSEKIIEAQDIILGRVNQICRKLGLNNVMAQLYTINYLNDKPMSLDSMVERLKISKGSVSVNIRALERYGAVRKVWVKGSRKDYYEAETDIIRVIMDRVKSLARDRISEAGSMLTVSYDTINNGNQSDKEEQEEADKFRNKLDMLKKLHQKAQYMLDLLNSDILNNMLNIKNIKGDEKESSAANA